MTRQFGGFMVAGGSRTIALLQSTKKCPALTANPKSLGRGVYFAAFFLTGFMPLLADAFFLARGAFLFAATGLSSASISREARSQ